MEMQSRHSTENLTIHHKVKDYSTWRKGYDDHEKSRRSAGITNGKVFRCADDPNDIVVLLDASDIEKARAWLVEDTLKMAMQNIGVIGTPSVRFES
jgi:hypothetical protein